MNVQPSDEVVARRLKEHLGAAPAPDFDAWRDRFMPELEQVQVGAVPRTPTKGRNRTVARWQVAASMLAVGGLLWLMLASPKGGPAVADELPGIDRATSMTWSETFYVRASSRDRLRSAILRERVDVQYQSPGKYRRTYHDPSGQVISIEIVDAPARRALTLDPAARRAELKEFTGPFDTRGPFAWVGDSLRGRHGGTVSVQGPAEFDGLPTQVLRWKGKEGESVLRIHLDQHSKRLVGMTSVNAAVAFDPDRNDEEPAAASKGAWHWYEPLASRTHAIALDASIGAEAFRLDAPPGYAVEQQAEPTVTEADMLEYLRAVADFNDGVFPDSVVEPFDTAKFNAASQLDESQRSVQAKALIDIRDRLLLREIYRAPILQFIEDHVEEDSFQYVGAEVRRGDASRLVLWYRPRGSSAYRAWYGDLSIREVDAAELPLIKE